MSRDLDFWFDFISPYGYLASLRIDELAARHGRKVNWHPVLVGVTVIRIMGLKPLMKTPLKREYTRREVDRYCRRHGVRLARDIDAPPMNPLATARLFAWLRRHAPDQARPFAQGALADYWARDIELGDYESAVECGVRHGVPRELLTRAVQDPQTGAVLRAAVDHAVARGVFGSPFVIVDGEPFFGVDKFELIDEWLARGGW